MLDEANKYHVKTNWEELERQKLLLLDMDNLFLHECGEEGVDKEIEESSDFSIELSSIISKINKLVLSNRSCTRIQQTTPNVKLPKLKLLLFDGDFLLLQWCTFWDLFQPSIYNREGLTGAQKIQYLVEQINSEATNLLQGFQTIDASYGEAVDLLKKT